MCWQLSKPPAGFLQAYPPPETPQPGGAQSTAPEHSCFCFLVSTSKQSPKMRILRPNFTMCRILLPWSSREKTTLNSSHLPHSRQVFPYRMDSEAERAEECGGPHSKPAHPSLLQHDPCTPLFPDSSGHDAFPNGNDFSAHHPRIKDYHSTRPCTNHRFKTSLPVGRKERQIGPIPSFPEHAARRESLW